MFTKRPVKRLTISIAFGPLRLIYIALSSRFLTLLFASRRIVSAYIPFINQTMSKIRQLKKSRISTKMVHNSLLPFSSWLGWADSSRLPFRGWRCSQPSYHTAKCQLILAASFEPPLLVWTSKTVRLRSCPVDLCALYCYLS